MRHVTWRATDAPADVGALTARLTLVVAPLIAFRVVPFNGGSVYSVMYLPLAILVCCYVKTPGARVPSWELALLGVLTLSILWSDEPGYSVLRLRQYLPLVLSTIVAGCIIPGPAVLRCLKTSFVILIGGSLVYLALRPTPSFRGGGDLRAQFDKNTYGGLLVVALLLLIERRSRVNLVLAPALVVLIVLNRSATAWVVGGLLVAATYLSRSLIERLGSAAKPQLFVLLLLGLGGAILLVFVDPDTALSALGKSTTLTGRTQIWAACWPEVKAAPWLGHGAFSFLDAGSGSPTTKFVWAQFQNYRPPHPHNGFLDLAGQIGYVGVAVYAALVLNGFRHGVTAALRGVSSARTALICLAFVLIFGVTEPTYLGSWLIVTAMLVAIAEPMRSLPIADEGPQRRPAAEPLKV